jgi:hypothetical protein
VVALATPAPPAARTSAIERGGEQLRSGRLFDGGPTLEDAILRAWDDLITDGSTDCPVCRAAMSPLGGCGSCGSELS